MNKNLAHIILFFFDVLSFFGLWYAYHEVNRVLMEITNQADIIDFGNRDFHMILVLIVPVAHALTITEHFKADLIKAHKKFLEYSAILMLSLLFAAGFIGSSWIKARAENAGYIYCRNASGISVLARTLVFTKNLDICEAQVSKAGFMKP